VQVEQAHRVDNAETSVSRAAEVVAVVAAAAVATRQHRGNLQKTEGSGLEIAGPSHRKTS
jgi:hypothetical protein